MQSKFWRETSFRGVSVESIASTAAEATREVARSPTSSAASKRRGRGVANDRVWCAPK
jgi:hypothetical protein